MRTLTEPKRCNVGMQIDQTLRGNVCTFDDKVEVVSRAAPGQFENSASGMAGHSARYRCQEL
jgi:hypothetical protein